MCMAQIGPVAPPKKAAQEQLIQPDASSDEEEAAAHAKYEFSFETLSHKQAQNILEQQKSKPFGAKAYLAAPLPKHIEQPDPEVVSDDGFNLDLDGIDLDTIEVVIRILLIGARDVGPIMGKKGQTLQHCRTVSGCKITMTNPPEIVDTSKLLKDGKTARNAAERILTLKGTQTQVLEAIEMLAAAIDRQINTIIDRRRTIEPVTFRLIIPKYLRGVILGRKGSSIAKLRNDFGVKVDLSNEVLAESSECLLTVQGDVEETPECIKEILSIIVMNGIKRAKHAEKFGGVPEPECKPYIPRIPQKFLYAQKTARDKEMDDKFEALKLAFDLAGKNGIPQPTQRSIHSRVINITKHEVRFPECDVGALMGTDGARIERIRRLSSAKIKIFAPMEGEDSRIIWIEGSMQSIQMALFLLNCCRDLYSNNSSTGMNDPFAKRADGSYTTPLGDWLARQNTRPEDQLVITAFFSSLAQRQAEKTTPGVKSPDYFAEGEETEEAEKAPKKKKKKNKNKKKKKRQQTSEQHVDEPIPDKKSKLEYDPTETVFMEKELPAVPDYTPLKQRIRYEIAQLQPPEPTAEDAPDTISPFAPYPDILAHEQRLQKERQENKDDPTLDMDISAELAQKLHPKHPTEKAATGSSFDQRHPEALHENDALLLKKYGGFDLSSLPETKIKMPSLSLKELSKTAEKSAKSVKSKKAVAPPPLPPTGHYPKVLDPSTPSTSSGVTKTGTRKPRRTVTVKAISTDVSDDFELFG